MNILDVSGEQVENLRNELGNGNDLDVLFALGKRYEKIYEVDKSSIHTKRGQEELRKLLYWTTEELYEFGNTLKIRPWTETEFQADELHLREELADIFNFVMAIVGYMNIDKKAFVELCLKKAVINDFRIRSGY